MNEHRQISDSEYERANRDAFLGSHPYCRMCPKRVCLAGETGITDDCSDDKLGVRVGKDVVHLGDCKVDYHAWLADSTDTVARAAAAFGCFKGCVLTRTVGALAACLVWLEFPRMTKVDVEELCFPESNLIRGKLITTEVVADRARQIASVVLASR
jgi:hypothetical protein